PPRSPFFPYTTLFRSHASEGDSAVELTAMLSALPEQVLKSVLCAALWLVLPLVCALLRPAALCLAALAAARGFVLALTVAVSIGDRKSTRLNSSHVSI